MSAYGGIYYSLDAFNGTFLYNNLCIDIDAGRHYISDYKGYSTDGMEMTIDNGVTVELYDGNGTLVRTVTATYDKIPLDGVSMIKLVGEGKFHRINITGFDSYHN